MCEYLDLYLHFWMIVLLGREFLVDIFFSFIISICLWAAVVSYEKMAIFALSLMNHFSFAIFKSLFLLILTHTIYDVYVGVFNGPAGIWDSVSPSIYVCISPASSLSLLPIDFSGFFFLKIEFCYLLASNSWSSFLRFQMLGLHVTATTSILLLPQPLISRLGNLK